MVYCLQPWYFVINHHLLSIIIMFMQMFLMYLRTFLKPYMTIHKFKIRNSRVVLSLEYRVISEALRRARNLFLSRSTNISSSIPLRLLKDAMGVVHPTNAAGQFRTPGFEKLKLPVTSSTQV